MSRIVVFALLMVGSIACTRRPVPPVSTAAAGNVVGVVGDVQITDQELMSRLSVIESQFPRKFESHPQKYEALREMMNLELLYKEALNQGLDKTYEFKTRLADLYVRRISEQARAEIKDTTIEQEYQRNRAAYDQVSAKHILLKFPKNADADAKKALRKSLEEIRAAVVKNPSSFGETAKSKSQDGSASSEGELGYFSRSMMVAPFAEAAFNLKNVGDISPIVETQYGYHIIQLSGDRRDIKFTKDQIRDALMRDSQRARLDAEIERLKKGKKFEIYEQSLLPLSPLPDIVKQDPEKTVNFKSQEK